MPESTPVRYFSPLQKARLALSILLIYWPIRVYVNDGVLTWADLRHNVLFFVVEITLTFFFFWGWVILIDWLQERLVHRLDDIPSSAFRWPVRLLSLVVATGLALIFSAGFGLVHSRMNTGFKRQFPGMGHPLESLHRGKNDNRQRTNNGLVIMAMLSAFYLTVSRRSSQQVQALQLRAERLQKEAVQAQFDALKNQASPHFLFSSLGILSSLVEIDTKLSVQFINRLSKAYRYILDQRDTAPVSLKTELDFIEAYTFLLNIRFDDRLQVTINVPEAARIRYAIVPLTLQLLVENAVKHNQLSDEEPLVVTIMLVGETLRVTNPIRLRPATGNSTGMGLQTISNRYRLLTDRPVRVGEHNGDFVAIIPLLSDRMSD